MTTILVTGGCGFIGSNFLNYMINKYPQYKFVNVDCLTYAGNLNNTVSFKNKHNYCFCKFNITNYPAMFQLFKGYNFDYVINFAAESHVDNSINSPEVFIDTNIIGTYTLLEQAKNFGIKKFIQISTDEVYGSLDFVGYFTEYSSISPNSPYSASKASADLLVQSYFKTYGLPINITRCTNNYGQHQHPEKLIPKIITNALQNKEIPVYGDGLNVRDWIHVKDHCRAIDLILHNGKVGEIYNIGSNNEKTNIDIVKLILNCLIKSYDLIKYVNDRKGHDRRYAIDSSKIKKLGWKPLCYFEPGIYNTISWYIDNEDWWKNLI